LAREENVSTAATTITAPVKRFRMFALLLGLRADTRSARAILNGQLAGNENFLFRGT
jgi:hypothetical protein